MGFRDNYGGPLALVTLVLALVGAFGSNRRRLSLVAIVITLFAVWVGLPVLYK